MKKSLPAILLAIMISVGANAQMTGGGSGNSTPKAAVAKSNGSKWGAVVIGLSAPMGKFGNNDGSLPLEEAVGAGSGVYIGYDAANYFSGTINNPVKIGFSSTFNLSINQVNWDSWGLGEGEYTPFILSGLKFGGIGSYEIIDALEADAFFRLGLNTSLGGMGYWFNNNYVDFYTETPAFGFGTEFGFNVRYDNMVMATLRFNPGKLTYSYYLETSDSFDEVEYKLPVSTVQVGIGFVFPKKK